MLKILSLIKSYKTISILVGGSVLIGGLFLGFNSLKNTYIEKGYNQAKMEYNTLLIKEINKNTEFYEGKLVTLRRSMQEQLQRDNDRKVTENIIDKEVVKVIEYIEREVYVKAECNTVSPDIIRMFNESISRTNNSKED